MGKMRKYIGYKVEAGMSLDIDFYFRGFITYFNGLNIVITKSQKFKEKQDAWKWISDTLREWENE